MSFEPDQLPDDADLTPPPRLIADLVAMQRTPAVPPAVDADVRRQAREHFARHRRIQIWRWTSGAAAAAVLLALGVWAIFPRPRPQVPQADARVAAAAPVTAPQANAPFLAEDIDHSGTVDVLDAFKVARGVKAHQTQPAWDINHDGVVDEQDVELIAKRAVRVTGGVQ